VVIDGLRKIVTGDPLVPRVPDGIYPDDAGHDG
jgi:hypothetical protein